MSLSLSVCSQSGPPICTLYWAFFRAFKALRALQGPQIKFSHILMHRPYQDLQNLKFSCLYLFPFSHKVVPQKASGGEGGHSRGGGGGGGGGGRIPHFNWSIYRGGNFFFFFFFVSGLKLDKKSIENGLEGQKFLVVCLFWGGCHHPNRLNTFSDTFVNKIKNKKCGQTQAATHAEASLHTSMSNLSSHTRTSHKRNIKIAKTKISTSHHIQMYNRAS